MNKVVWKLGMVLALFSILLISACAKPPTEEMAKADKAIADAKAKEADLYVPDIFTKAQDQMNKANEMVTAKKYKEAKTAALEVVKLTQEAVSLIEQNKQKMKEELEKMLPDLQKALDETKSAATAAIKKKAVSSKEELQSTIGKFELDMTSVKEQLQAGKIKQASDLAKMLLEQINAQKQSLIDMAAQQKPAKK